MEIDRNESGHFVHYDNDGNQIGTTVFKSNEGNSYNETYTEDSKDVKRVKRIFNTIKYGIVIFFIVTLFMEKELETIVLSVVGYIFIFSIISFILGIIESRVLKAYDETI